MNQLFAGSICLTDLVEKAKSGHSAFSKAQNGKVYANILTWLNDEVDKFGNCMSHQLSSSKENRDKEQKFYLGNSKRIETNKPVTSSDVDDDFSNVQTRQSNTHPVIQGASTEFKDAADDLPF